MKSKQLHSVSFFFGAIHFQYFTLSHNPIIAKIVYHQLQTYFVIQIFFIYFTSWKVPANFQYFAGTFPL